MLLRKTLNLDACDIKLDGAGGHFSGYASVFGGVDSYGDTIIKGAYNYSLTNNGKPKMFFGHESYALPIGKWLVAKEDDHGLYVEGELTPGLTMASDVHAAMKHGTLDGLSVGILLKKNDFEVTADGNRIIRRITKLVEVSPVTFPADTAARITAVKGQDTDDLDEAISDLETLRDFERLLRDAAGLTRQSAQKLIAKAKTIFTQRDAGDEGSADKDMEALALRLRKYLPQQ